MVKAKLRQHEQRTSNEVRTKFVPFGARTANTGKTESIKQIFALLHVFCPDITPNITLYLPLLPLPSEGTKQLNTVKNHAVFLYKRGEYSKFADRYN